MEETNIISRREYLDLCIKMASSAFANPYGEEEAKIRASIRRTNMLLDELGFEVDGGAVIIKD
jgi:hypothetical protein